MRVRASQVARTGAKHVAEKDGSHSQQAHALDGTLAVHLFSFLFRLTVFSFSPPQLLKYYRTEDAPSKGAAELTKSLEEASVTV